VTDRLVVDASVALKWFFDDEDDIAPFAAEIYRAAVDLGRTTYDTAYVVLAERMGVAFVTGDRRLHNSICSKKPFVRHIADFAPPAPPQPTQP